MIEASSVTKAYGKARAVDSVSFSVAPGRVTGFLGPNGAGKSTTMRMIVGLDRPTSGVVAVNGRRYADHRAPLHEVGALLDAKAVHPSRSARNHLLALAATHGISRKRVSDVIEMTGIGRVANNRTGSYSLGMGQRLGIAAALLGDPQTVILDEPVNGLDPEGFLWVRQLARGLAEQGRTVFLSSHLMSEMAQTADHLLVIGRGRILADAPIAEILSGGDIRTLVGTDRPDELRAALLSAGADVLTSSPDSLMVSGVPPRRIAEVAQQRGVLVYELTPQRTSLEEAYLELTKNEVEYRSAALPTGGN